MPTPADPIPIDRAGGLLRFHPPGSDPVPVRHIIGVGRNYADHAAEMGADVPDHPLLFCKNPASAIPGGDRIVIPRICQDRDQVDFEGELAVVIGRPTRDATEADAADPGSGIVLGYCCANDVSARWWQKQGSGGQFNRGKSFDTFCPLGPTLIPPAIVEQWGGPQALTLRTIVSGEEMQRETTDRMMFTVTALIAACSAGATLLPGTVILTGTPKGVGAARDPQRFLRDGDEVTIELGTPDDPAALGRLTNKVEREP